MVSVDRTPNIKGEGAQNSLNLSGINNSNIIKDAGSDLKRIIQMHQSQQQSGRDFVPNTITKNSLGLSPIRRVNDPSLNIKNKFSTHKNSLLSPTKKLLKKDFHLQEMLGAGSDPLAKNQEFSHLISSPADLMNAKFVKPPNARIRYPPVIDLFARTLAAPISSTKFSLSVSARIGSNYNPAAKFLHIEPEIKGIKYIMIKESKIQLTALPEFLETPATAEEELFYVTSTNKKRESFVELEVRHF